MTTRDIKNNVLVVHSLSPAARTDGTVNGTKADLRGYESAMVLFHVGARTDGSHALKVTESSDDSTYTEVAAADLHGSLTAVAGAGQQNAVQAVGYIGNKPYIKAQIVTTGSTSGAIIGATIIKGHPVNAPAA